MSLVGEIEVMEKHVCRMRFNEIVQCIDGVTAIFLVPDNLSISVESRGQMAEHIFRVKFFFTHSI